MMRGLQLVVFLLTGLISCAGCVQYPPVPDTTGFPGQNVPTLSTSSSTDSTRLPLPTAAIPITGSQATLSLTFVDEHGRPVLVDKVELLMQKRSDVDRVEIARHTDGVVLALDEAALRSQWPQHFALPWMYYHLLITAEGYAPVQSHKFVLNPDLFGYPTYDEVVTEGLVEFPSTASTARTTEHGQDITLAMRRPEPRQLCFVDDRDIAVTGVAVTSYLFWSNDNHCGALSGVEKLAQGTSDTNGCLLIPDGEFEYAFEIRKPDHILVDPGRGFWDLLIRRLSEPVTQVHLDRFVPEPLELTVSNGEGPIAGKALYGQWAGCPCGLCAIEITTTDERGHISLPEFFPEEWDFLFLWDESRDYYVWIVEQEVLLSHTGPIEVQLAE